MNLVELYETIDWSEIDAEHEVFLERYPSSKPIESVKTLRLEMLYKGLESLQGKFHPICWFVIPSCIRSQIQEIYKENGLLHHAAS